MTAKSKAFQAMAVISVAALTYTLSNSSSGGNKPPVVSQKEQTMPVVVVTTKKAKKEKQSQMSAAPDNHVAVPGYSNPDDSSK